MKLTKKIEAEIKLAMNDYWQSYLKGNLDQWASYLVNDYRNIGTTEVEIWNSKKEIFDYSISVLDQMVGLTELRNKKTEIIPYDPYVMVHEYLDIYIKGDDKWMFYSKLRLSSLMQKIDKTWKILHQHGSYPDSKVVDGEFFSFDTIKSENIKLQEAVKNRTEELEQSNRELEIEAALERVRTVAMGMKKSEDLLSICEVSFTELQKLGFDNLRNAVIHVPNDEQNYFMDYDYSEFTGGDIAKIEYGSHPIVDKYIEKIQSAQDAYFEVVINKEQLSDWKEFRKKSGQSDDSRIDQAEALYYYLFSIGIGDIGISTFKPISDSQIKILKRFRNVFDLAYRRYNDITLAEAQVREAQIEAALERVRAKSMAMHKSDELADLSFELVKQVQALGISTWFCAFNIYDDDPRGSLEWGSNAQGTYEEYRTPREGIFLRYYEAGQGGEKLLINEIGEDECPGHYEYLCSLPGVGEQLLQMKDAGISFPTSQIDHVAFFKYGYIIFITFEPALEAHNIFIRFAKVFEQTYTRFLDLKKAEAQAREAKIETALEKVRARTMGMQKSDELLNTGELLYKELFNLGIQNLVCGYVLIDEEKNVGWNYGVNPGDGTIKPKPTGIPQTGTKILQSIREGWEKQKPSLLFELDEEETIEHQTYIAKNSANFPLSAEKLLSISPKKLVIHTFNFKQGYLLIVGDIVLDAKQQEMIIRFTKVFEQTYTRFLDLKKAEAQAREAQIEGALERVRSRSMGMQKSEELKEVIQIVYEQFVQLDINIEHTGFIMDYKAREDMYIWLADKHEVPFQVTIPYFDSPHWNSFNEAKANGKDFFANHLSFEEKNKFYQDLFKYIPGVPDETKEYYFNCPGLAISTVLLDNVGLYIENFSGTPYSDEENKLLMRFGKVFQQTYTRFLDLQKAEAQVKEAQIEAALERVRARAMGMHKSEEVGDVSDLLFSELNKLNLDVLGCSVVVIDEDKDKMELWRARSNVAIKPFESTSFSKAMNLLKKNMPDWFPIFRKALGKRKKYLVDELLDDRRSQFINAIAEQYKYSDAEKTQLFKNAPEKVTTHYIFFKLGYLALLGENKLSDENLSITRRFVEVFEFSYTRFLDIKNAEEQAREAKIEACLERARAQSMMMQHSGELNITSQVFHEQLRILGIDSEFSYLWLPDEVKGEHLFWATWQEVNEGSFSFKNKKVIYPLDKSEPAIAECYVAWESGMPIHVNPIPPTGVESYFNTWSELLEGVDKFKPKLYPAGLYYVDAYMKYGCFGIMIRKKLSEDEQQVLHRFSREFERAYTRFLDLKKAEEQAREAQTELSLERIRAQVTAMKESEEILEIVVKMRTEFVSLGYEAAYFWYMKWTPEKYLKAMTSGDGTRIGMVMELPRKIHGEIKNLADWEKSSEPLVIHVMDVEATLDYVHKMVAWGDFKQIDPNMPTEEDIRKIGGLTYVMARTIHGEIGYSLPGMVPNPAEDALSTLVRFAKVFDLAYKRFEDLKRSEQQFRESQIELGLERVRTKAMSMHSSDDLSATVNVFFAELKTLGIIPIRCGVGQIDDMTRTTNLTTTTSSQQGNSFEVIGKVKQSGHPILDGIYDNWKIQKDYFPVLEGSEIKAYYGVMNKQVSYPDYSEDITQYGNMFYFKEGFVFAWTENKLSEGDLQIFRRFTSVLSLTYTRFIDLQQAEFRAREAEQQASLDRVRGEIASMRTTEDLEKITPLIWRELTTLGIPFFRCGIFIFDELNSIAHAYLSTPLGKSLAALHIKISETWLENAVQHWRMGKIYHENWNREQFIAWTQRMMDQGFVDNKEQFQAGKEAPEKLSLQLLPFKQGMLYVGSRIQLSELEIKTAQKLADSFGVAYARYEDFQKLEAANHRKSLELEEARQLQLAMLPKVLPRLPHLDIAVYMQTATEVGGDYYDFNVGENDELTAVIGDATGHGMKAGTIVTITKSLFHSMASNKNILDTFAKISKVIKDMKFRQLAMCLLMLKIYENKMVISSAAMPPALIFRKKKNLVEEIELKGMPLGAMENFPYQIKDTSIDNGDTILLMSDGMPELHNGTNEMYGYDRIMSEFNIVGNKAPEGIIDHFKKSAAEWINGNDPDDDITFVVIKVK